MRLMQKIRPQIFWGFLQNKLAPALVLIYQLAVIVAFVLIPMFSLRWLKLPFVGAFFDRNLRVSSIMLINPDSWQLQRSELPSGYYLTALDAKPIGTIRQLSNLISQKKPGEQVMLTLQDLDEESFDKVVTLVEFPFVGRVTFFLIPYLIGLVYLGCSIWIFSLRRGDAIGRAYSLFSAATGLGLAGLFDTFTTHELTTVWIISIALIGGSLFDLTLLFPEPTRLSARYPALRWVGFVPSAILVLFSVLPLYYRQYSISDLPLYSLSLIYTGLVTLTFLLWTTIRRFTSISPIAREQARLIVWGAGVSLAPLAVSIILASIWNGLSFSPLTLLPLGIFPVLTGYAVLRHRVLNTGYVLSRTLQFITLTVMAATAYALLVGGLSLFFGSTLPANNPLLIGLMVFLLAILLTPVRTLLQRNLDSLFFRGQMAYQERLQSFGRNLTQTTELPAIVRLLRQTVQEGMHPNQLHIFMRDALSGQYAPEPDENGQPTTDMHFPSNSALVQTLTARRSSIFLSGSDTLPIRLQSERARLALLGVQLFVPLPGQRQLVGWIGLGVKRSGELYTNNDLRYLESLGDQAALAVERAQVVANLEKRVHEMDVLTRVAQGINITLVFDDILELIYAQINLLIPTRDLRITLFDNGTHTLYHAFFLQDDERLRESENKPLGEGQYLEEDIIRNQRALMTDDLERECRSRGFLSHDPDIFAWMGVPLNAGAESIGVFGVGSRDPSLVYTEQQLNLLQAIADQAASAIVKARLLQESEQRTRQLATLNEVGKSLTSTLELHPLLNKILQSATEILNCEAGSLFMLDSQTSELIFENTVGPVAAELIGQRLPAGTGLVGEAVITRQAIIANDVHKTQAWSNMTDKQTGFVTRDLMVVPMQVHERVIGVIEVINKIDGSPFNPADQELLTTFASQAAITVENARLYTQTDKALSARVEELSVMQRIDRELNASLDLERAMRITLEWAMRQSRSDAGLAGLLDDYEDRQPSALNIITYLGYDQELGQPTVQENVSSTPLRLPVEMPGLRTAIEAGQTQELFVSDPIDDSGSSTDEGDKPPLRQMLLTGGKSQLVIPIQRTTGVIGIMMLESKQKDAYPKETVAFLSRLSDHAAIAISNAQLYADLEAANLAKSDFVSLVSHELKTPMTSIRGYADLLAKGVVGPINEVQANFLNTIRSNVGRMSTLVSDLTDVSRIEAGRLRLEFNGVLLPGVLQDVIISQHAQIDEKKQTLLVNIPKDLPPVWGDQIRITQILTNLLNNANKYTLAGGNITISAELSARSGESKGLPEMVQVSVCDTGIGISPSDQHEIFQKFFRSGDQNVRESPGTGLGLNITRHLVEMQGGQIWFESESGKGTTFYFTIPVAAGA
jgi:signal transduction histidine kinase